MARAARRAARDIKLEKVKEAKTLARGVQEEEDQVLDETAPEADFVPAPAPVQDGDGVRNAPVLDSVRDIHCSPCTKRAPLVPAPCSASADMSALPTASIHRRALDCWLLAAAPWLLHGCCWLLPHGCCWLLPHGCCWADSY